MPKEKDFYESQSIFSKWCEGRKFENCNCYYQIYSQGVLIEKWQLGNFLYLVELYPNGNGFTIFSQEK